jgi:putative ABC transport system permease protein
MPGGISANRAQQDERRRFPIPGHPARLRDRSLTFRWVAQRLGCIESMSCVASGEFGTLIGLQSHDERNQGVSLSSFASMTAIVHDIRYTLRMLARSPGFAVIAIATLALGIGANTAVFSVVNAVLLKPLPFAASERLMLVHMLRADEDAGTGVYRESVWSYAKYRSFVDRQQAFEDSALFSLRDVTLAGENNPQRVRAEVVTERYPAVLGTAPAIGRAFTYEEANTEGADAVAMLGHALWTSRYGADPAIVGRPIAVNGRQLVVVGVLPRGFRGLSGNADLWTPIPALEPTELTEATNHSFSMIARRRADVSLQQALADVRRVGQQVGVEYASRDSASAATLYDSRADADVRRAALVLLGAVGFVLLISCVNLTNLLAAKTLGRRRELAIRAAIGASGKRLGRQFVVESLVLATLGALGGLFIAYSLLSAAAVLLPDSNVFFGTAISPGVPRVAGAAGLTRIGASAIGLDGATLLFTCLVTFATAAVVGLVLAARAASASPIDALKAAGSVGWAGRREHAARATLLVAQIALAAVLLAGAGLMVRSAAELRGTGIGIESADMLTVRVDLPPASYTAEQGRLFYAQLLERVRLLPGIEAASMASCAPVSGGCNATGLSFVRTGVVDDSYLPIGVHWATPEHFEMVGVRLLQGRGLSDSDRIGQPKVLLVNEAAARAYWPNDTPIGKFVAVGQGGFHDGAEVVGVVADVRYGGIESAATPDVYIPLAQSYRSRMQLFVRSGLDTQSLVAAISGAVRELDPNLPLSEVKSLDERFSDAMWRTRVGAWLLSAFAGVALLLTAIGIFGVIAQTVGQRTAEIGVRMTLGARAPDVLRLVLGHATLLVTFGVVVGTTLALALTRLLGALLYGVEAHDPPTFIAVALLLSVVALAACYIPARRATRIDTVVALRSE